MDLARCARLCLRFLEPDAVISGMALGWDQALAEAALDLGIPLIAALPFDDHGANWSHAAQARHHVILGRAFWSTVVSPGAYATAKYHVRDRWIVDHGTHVLALWDGTASGTGSTVTYAKARGVRVFNAWEIYQVCRGEYYEDVDIPF